MFPAARSVLRICAASTLRRPHLRSLHTTSPLCALKSPKVRSSQRPKPSAPSGGQPKGPDEGLEYGGKLNVEDALPPAILLQGFVESEGIASTPEQLLSTLRRYCIASNDEPNDEWSAKLFADAGLYLDDIYELGSTIIENPAAPKLHQRILAKRLLHLASARGHILATELLVTGACQRHRINNKEYSVPLRKLETMVRGGRFQSMHALSIARDCQQRYSEALELCEEALQACRARIASGSGLQPDDVPPRALHDIKPDNFWRYKEAVILIWRGILLSMKPQTETVAEDSFRIAALELDHPDAYFGLSNYREFLSEGREKYLIKAASSGLLDACKELAVLYWQRSQLPGPLQVRKRDKRLAYDWMEISAENGFGSGFLGMADLLMSERPLKVAKVEHWLAKAENYQNYGNPKEAQSIRSQAAELREKWEELREL